MSEQDNCADDIEDVEKMQTDDPDTSFISRILNRKNFAVYIHSKSQHEALHKLHQIRAINGMQITVRVDATGGVARDVGPEKMLYCASTTNFKIKNQPKSTALPLTEHQYNIRHTSKDIAAWLFDFALSHATFYEYHPLLFDWLISDFSYANFHAVKGFHNLFLRDYLNMAYNWIYTKINENEFPSKLYEIVKIRMCYTHLMHTFADNCKRHYGTLNRKQLPHSRVILEILGSMIQESDYSKIE